MTTRFLFVEGVMGAGKTTTASWLSATRATTHATGFIAEGPTADAPIHQLRIGPGLSHPLASWLDLTVAEYVELSLSRWGAFVSNAASVPTIHFCDGLLFHGNLTDLLLMDADEATLEDYATRLMSRLEPLSPAVVYLRRADVREALEAAIAERGIGWRDYQVNWKVGSPYAIRRGLAGFEGLVSLYEDYVGICDRLFAHLVCPKLRVEHRADWAGQRRQILTFVDSLLRA